MKVKELKRTVNVCWSPAEHYPVTLAAGAAAQQVDASFNSSSYLDLYTLNLEDPGLDLELTSSLQTQHKFQKIVWSGAGVLIGGCDGGLLQFYSVEKLLNSASDALVGSSTKHNGHVSALDINPYQKNLLASGASESEIYIWDLNNTSQPMAPGNRNQPYDHVQGLAWNQQVQHILGSTFATRCVVWDLRKNEPIMKLSDSQSRTRWRSLAWHPSVATQLCIASEDDQVPVIQLWDLRLAASPLVTLEGHNKGVMALSWCRQDPDLLLSAGKDGRVLCWNPNSTKPGGELLTEISQQQQWVFDVSWCARDPGLLAAASFDQQVAVHSLLGGSRPEMNTHNQSNIMDSFGGADSFSALPQVSRASQPVLMPTHQLPVPPNWLKRPVAAKFSFGGKLVTFEKCPQEAGPQKFVYISQVVSEPDIVERATELDAVLGSCLNQDPGAADMLAEYCRQKGDISLDQNERYRWFFLRANFLPAYRTEVLNLLGFKQDEIPSKFRGAPAPGGEAGAPDGAALSRGESTETEAELSTDTSTDLSDAQTLIERKLANIELSTTVTNIVIPNGEDATSLICRALVCGNLEEAVELCLEAKRVADAMVIASLGSQELVYRVQKYHLSRTAQDPVSLVSGSLLLSRWDALVRAAAAASWRDTLAALVTHCDGEALAHYCEMLGDKLSKETDPSLSEAASICYLCAMSPEALLARWSKTKTKRGDMEALAALTEVALLARRAAQARGRQVQAGGKLESILNEYASRLASQGCLQSALNTLEGIQHTELRDRLMRALGIIQEQRRASHQPQQPQQPQQAGGRVRTVSSHAQRRGHTPAHPELTNAYNTVPSTFEQSSWQQASVPTALPPGGFPARGFNPTGPQPSVPLQPTPPQPPRPASDGPQAGSLSSRSKYKVDPSVQSAPLYNQYNFNNPITSQPYGYNTPLPDQYATAGVPTFNQPINPVNPGQNLNPGQGLMPANPALNNGYYNPGPAPVEQTAPAAQKPAAPGWNDPPMLSSKPKTKPQELQSQAPITHPLFGVEPPQHVPLAPAAQYPGQQYPGQYNAQQYPGQYNAQQYPAQQYQDQHQGQYPAAMPPAYQQQQQQTESAAPAEPVPAQKPPLPEQHAVLQHVFDSMRTQCASRATNPQMKRKLEDVQRRLEMLYDLLREYKLSESALATLHSCAQYAEAHNFAGATSLCTTLASGTDFAAAASFLPGLKVLFQLATQLELGR